MLSLIHYWTKINPLNKTGVGFEPTLSDYESNVLP